VTGVRHAIHLVKRFFGSLRPGGPPAADDAWARAHLLPAEQDLWSRMSGPDRRHAATVARDVERQLGQKATRPVLAAALLHDVGKIEAGLGTFGRVAATVVAGVAGHERVAGWAGHPGLAGRIGRYVKHPDLGGFLLAGAGSDALTMAWALEHHRPAARWTVPPDVAAVLKSADD
jgi:hypothetical protein